jgi:superoxide reductase
MAKKFGIYKCEICGNIVEVLHEGAGDLVCCGQPMNLFEEKENEEGSEKHLPVIEEIGENRIKVKVGSVAHPMEDEHYIEWIEVLTKNGDRNLRKFLKPGEKPEKMFTIREPEFSVRILCNVHGLWKK